MAKSKGEPSVSKTQLVREFLTAQPNAMPKEVSEKLKEDKGVDVSPQIVSQIKYQMRLMGGHPAIRGRGASAVSTELSAQELVRVKQLADELGSSTKIEQALEILKKLN